MSENVLKVSKVRVENESNQVIVPITSSLKPEVTAQIKGKWQQMLNLIAELLQVPAALVMKLEGDSIHVFATSHTNGNPYHKDDAEKLGLGLYCETVVGRRQELLVPNALKSPVWKENPDVKLNMISYLGVPVAWNDGEIFGTFCVLDNKENHYSKLYIDILHKFKDYVESDLNQLVLLQELKGKLSGAELRIREAHHRIKNQFNLLISSIRLQSRQIVDDDELPMILNEITSRIKAVSLVHEKLYMSKKVFEIPILDYVTELCESIFSSLSDNRIQCSIDGDTIHLNQKIMLPIGLVLVEMVTNSIKHAFHSTQHPQIRILVKSVVSSHVAVSYQDNGIGLPPDFDIASADSFGMAMIDSLMDQLDSRIEPLPGKGFHCTFAVPVV